MSHYCFKADSECDLDIDEAFMEGYKDALEDFEKALLQNNVIDKSVVRRIKEQLRRHEE